MGPIHYGAIICEYLDAFRCFSKLNGSRWNAARAFASFLDDNQYLYKDKNVLELGAGGGLPGIVCALNGARKVRNKLISLYAKL